MKTPVTTAWVLCRRGSPRKSALLPFIVSVLAPCARGQQPTHEGQMATVELTCTLSPETLAQLPAMAASLGHLQPVRLALGRLRIESSDCASRMELPPKENWLGQVAVTLPVLRGTMQSCRRREWSTDENPYSGQAISTRLELEHSDPIRPAVPDSLMRDEDAAPVTFTSGPAIGAGRTSGSSGSRVRVRGAALPTEVSAMTERLSYETAGTRVALAAEQRGLTRETREASGDAVSRTTGLTGRHGTGVSTADASVSRVGRRTGAGQVTVTADRAQLTQRMAAGAGGTEAQVASLAKTQATGQSGVSSGQTGVVQRTGIGTTGTGSERRQIAQTSQPGVQTAEARRSQAIVSVGSPGIGESEKQSSALRIHGVAGQTVSQVEDLRSGLVCEVKLPDDSVALCSLFDAYLVLTNRGKEPVCRIVLRYQLETGFHVLGRDSVGNLSLVRVLTGADADALAIEIPGTLGAGQVLAWKLPLIYGPSATIARIRGGGVAAGSGSSR